jgi:hypothetical protein
MIGLAVSLMIQLTILAIRVSIVALQLLIAGVVMLGGAIAGALESRR